MNKTLIIRNNDRKNKIYENALESYHKGELKKYYSPKALDVKELKELREITNKQKILLLICKRQTIRLTLKYTPLDYERRGFLHSSGRLSDHGIK